MAEIERVEILLLIDPFVLRDNLAMHQRNLPGGAAEAQAADAREDAHELAEIRNIC
ncbi:hypothetical protein [Blastomonas sp. UPD001]|uniref:hypothetical protein n=1 Tax=Blastomonas sp. UPD001 TaxID=2217673 RepID=UPI001E5465C6|nr:hypothetical protein [Blastomonas sp. UPD001]